nr:zinc finger BED domain-containing protein RICESLEEPER 2-like [Ipomoea batatas]
MIPVTSDLRPPTPSEQRTSGVRRSATTAVNVLFFSLLASTAAMACVDLRGWPSPTSSIATNPLVGHLDKMKKNNVTYCTVSMWFLPELYTIKEILCQKAVSVEPWMKNMAQKMQQKFDKYWGSSNLLLSIAAVLDPRNKMTFIEFSFPVIYSEYEATRQIAIVRDSLYGLYKIYLDKYAATSKENDFQAMDTSENCVATTTWKGKGLVVETGRSKFEKFVRNVETVQNVKSELDTYLQDG